MYHIGPEVSVKEHPVLYKAYCCMWLLQYFSKVLEQLSLYVIHFHEYRRLNDGFDCNLACNSHCWTLRFYSFTQSHTGVDESKHFKCFFFFRKAVYTLLQLNKQENAVTMPVLRCEQIWIWRAAAGWNRRGLESTACAERQTGTCCSLISVTTKSLVFHSALPTLCQCILSFLSGAPHPLLQSVVKHKRGNLVTPRRALKYLSSNHCHLCRLQSCRADVHVVMQSIQPLGWRCVGRLWTLDFVDGNTTCNSHLCVSLNPFLCEACWHSILPLLL